jgi:hypothetical protein
MVLGLFSTSAVVMDTQTSMVMTQYRTNSLHTEISTHRTWELCVRAGCLSMPIFWQLCHIISKVLPLGKLGKVQGISFSIIS